MSVQGKTISGSKTYDDLKKKIAILPNKPRTEELTIENNQAPVLDKGLFQGYTALTSLYISGNEINTIKNGTFDGVPGMKYLYLNNNNIQAVESEAFKGMSKLCDLDLSCNKLTTLPPGIFESFAMTANGATLNLSNNQIAEIIPEAIKNVTVLYGTLDFSNNKLTRCPTGLFIHLLIENLDLSGNAITTIEEHAFERSNFRFLHLERNAITDIHPEAFLKLEIQSELHLSSNKIKPYAGMFKCIPGLKELYLDDNGFTTLPANFFDGLSKVDTLSLNKNKLVLEKQTFDKLPSLEYLHVADNGFSELKPGTFKLLKELRNLNLSYNKFKVLKANTLWEAASEDEKTFFFILALHHSEIEKIEPGAFDGVDRIEDLQLYGNKIHQLEEGAFKGLSYVGLVNLQNNVITHEEILNVLPPCRQVMLGGNKLQGGVQPNNLGVKNIEMISFNRTCHRWDKEEEKYKLDEYFIETNVIKE